ncbi:MAG: gfo/Idh/MocA family oxidoreductase, partial [Planktotalea sp.]
LFLDGSGQLHVRKHGAQQSQSVASVEFDETTFGGGCVKALITHVVEALLGDAAMENTAKDYLPVLHICEAAYRSAQQGQKISLPESEAR